MNRARLVLAALLAIAVLATASPVLAGSTQTGVLRGKVTAEDGSPLPGVTLTLSSPAQIRDRAVVTDGDGNFFVPGLAPGDYKVTAQLSGFTTIVVDTEVVLDQTTVLPVVLREGELTETVTVTGAKPVVEKTQTESALVLDKEFTENLPVGRSYQSLLQFAPGVTGGSNPNVLGGTSNSNVYLVDGVSIRDPVTGTFGGNLNFDAIEAVDIKLTGVSAEYGQFQGGLTNVITKSGGNTFTGSVRNVIDKGRWTSLYHTKTDQYFPNGEPPSSGNVYATGDNKWTFTPEFTAGGPIVPDSAWFFISYRRPQRSNGASLGNSFGGPNNDGVYNNTFEGDYSTGKITWQIFEDHRVQMQYTEDPADTTRDYGALFFGPGAYDTEAIDFQSQGGFVWIGNWNASWTPTIFTDFKVAHFENTFDIRPLTPILPPFPGQPLSGTGEVGFFWDLFGSGYVYDANIFDETPEIRERDQFEGSVTMFFDTSVGTHTIKVGADYQEQTTVGDSIIQGNAYFIGGFANDPVFGGGNPRDINNRLYYIWYDFAPPADAAPSNEYTAVYIQDDWQVNENLSMNIGVRYEDSLNQNDVGEKVIDQDDFAPRLGVSWDITGEAKHVVKATAARYLSGINLTTLSPFVRNSGGQSSYDGYLNANLFDADPLNDFGVPAWFLVASVRPSPEASTFPDDLAVQYIDELTLGYEYAFSPTLGASIKLVDREWNEIITQKNDFTYDGFGTPIKLTRFENNDDAKRDYQAVFLQMDKRFSNNWQMLASYVYSESEGNVTSDSGFDTYGNYSGVGPATNNKFGLLPWDVKHDVKLQGFYRVPLRSNRHSLTVGSTFDYTSGNPYEFRQSSTAVVVGPGFDGVQDVPLGSIASQTPGSGADQTDNLLVLFEERGSRREPSNWRLNFNFTYGFQFSQKVRFETRFEIFNVTNNQKPLRIRNSGSAFGSAASYNDFQNPQNFRLNLALLW